ncbi:MAG: hypothetical protein KDB68_10925 [Planctomycetes bacterium]|nr:hypothetical protein [Planctomycetota bacterium]
MENPIKELEKLSNDAASIAESEASVFHDRQKNVPFPSISGTDLGVVRLRALLYELQEKPLEGADASTLVRILGWVLHDRKKRINAPSWARYVIDIKFLREHASSYPRSAAGWLDSKDSSQLLLSLFDDNANSALRTLDEGNMPAPHELDMLIQWTARLLVYCVWRYGEDIGGQWKELGLALDEHTKPDSA